MKYLTVVFLFAFSFSSWAGCDEINAFAEKAQAVIPTSDSGYMVDDNNRVFFFSAPDNSCKIKDVFIIKGDSVNVYAEYNGFSSVMYFKKNGEPVSGWIHSSSIKPTGTGVGPKQEQ